MSRNQVTSSMRICATCAKWGGGRGTDSIRAVAIFESEQKGECLGGGFNRIQKEPHATCGQWEVWPIFN